MAPTKITPAEEKIYGKNVFLTASFNLAVLARNMDFVLDKNECEICFKVIVS